MNTQNGNHEDTEVLAIVPVVTLVTAKVMKRDRSMIAPDARLVDYGEFDLASIKKVLELLEKLYGIQMGTDLYLTEGFEYCPALLREITVRRISERVLFFLKLQAATSGVRHTNTIAAAAA